MNRRRAPAPDGEKRCARCGEFWPADRAFFSPNASARDGLAWTCRACQSDHKRAVRGLPAGYAPGITADVADALARALRPGGAR
jgi:hypothetical protein